MSIKKLLNRFNNFIDAEIRSIKLISPVEIELDLAVQDSARAFDWINLKLSFSSVYDANLLENSKLQLIDSSNGFTLLQEGTDIAFTIGECYNIADIKNQRLYIIAKTLKTSESPF